MALKLSDLELGALVGDASAMGLHWLYDQNRIAEIAGKQPEFRNPNVADYTKGYFAHGGKRAGDLSQYGWQMLVMSWALQRKGNGYDRALYLDVFEQVFGFGGAYFGYIDRPTRTTLLNKATTPEGQLPKGADDTQLPAISKLPPLIAAFGELPVVLLDVVESAVRVTNDNGLAVRWAKFAAVLLHQAMRSEDRLACIWFAIEHLNSEEAAAVERAIDTTGQNSSAVVDKFGTACQLNQAMPSIVHLYLTHKSAKDGLRANIMAGGDSCGRGVLLGALYAAQGDLPSDWLTKVRIPDL